MDKTSLGDRIKAYESVSDIYLMKRVPVIIRLDGKAFHSLTKKAKFTKPFDTNFVNMMSYTMRDVASKIQGCVLGYTQSDEISFVLLNNKSIKDEPFLGNRILKIASITSSMVTSKFAKYLNNYVPSEEAYFDSRVFTVPSNMEAINTLIWRQQDCVRNSILSSSYYEIGKKVGLKTAQKMMFGLNTSELQELMFKELGMNWNDYSPELKRGIVTYRKVFKINTENGEAIRSKWVVEPAPIFQSEDGMKWLMSLMTPEEHD